ncbi:MAG: glycosyltransferase family 4 protein [Anaerolineae bacterium]|nr:glycosyltransferase family 4 protein [Anaerolineae bacterium]
MKILFLTQVLPYPLVGGPKIRAYYMLRHLAQQHEVTLVSFVRTDDRPEDVAHLAQVCAAVHTVPMVRSRLRDGRALLASLLSGQPAAITRDRVPAMERLLARLVRETAFDVVHADQTAMAQYALHASDQSAAQGHRPRTLLDQHNAMYLLVARQAAFERGPARLIWRREARLFRSYELGLLRDFDHILWVTEDDLEAAARLAVAEGDNVAFDRAKQTVVPICVDPQGVEAVVPAADAAEIVHLGTMFWPPNVEGVLWFAEQVLPLLLRELPDAHLTVAGKGPPPAVQALAEPGSPLCGHVDVAGFVPDARPLLQQTRAFIVPVRAGGGMRVKIVDGWQWALPVISTTIGAEGIQTRNGENILLADSPEAFAAAVVRVLTDDRSAAALRANGRRWVETHYNWRTVYPALVDPVYKQLGTGV